MNLHLLDGVDVSTVAVIVLSLLGVVFLFGEQLWKVVGSLRPSKALSNLTGEEERPRVVVLNKLDDCYTYFDKSGCKEGMEAIKVAITHVYHSKTEHGPQ